MAAGGGLPKLATARTGRRTESTIIDSSSIPKPVRPGVFSHIHSSVIALALAFSKSWRRGSNRRSSTVLQAPESVSPPLDSQLPTFLDPVLTFNEEEKSFYGAASICGIRPYNEDAFRVITNMEMYAKSLRHDSVTPRTLLDSLIQNIGATETEEFAALTANFSHHVDQHTAGSQYYGVFDGHAGKRCSTLVAQILPLCVAAAETLDRDVEEALRTACLTMDKYFLDVASARGYKDGCTAISALVRRRQVTIANVGDCRAILCTLESGTNRASTKALSKDQKPNCAEEKARIEAAGGIVLNIRGVPRVNGMLAVARAFGDLPLKRYIVAEPVVTRFDLRPNDEYVVLATDGLWDVLSNDAVWSFIRTHRDEVGIHDVALRLANLAVELGSADNVTVVIIDVRCRR